MLRAAGTLTLDRSTGFLMFSGPVIGWVLKSLYGLNDGVPWYGWYYASVLCLAHTTLLYALLLRFTRNQALTLFGSYYLAAGCYLSLAWQFTALAYIAFGVGFIGFCLFKYAPKSQSSERLLLGLSSFLFVASAMIRLESFLSGLILTLPLILYQITSEKKNRRVAFILGGAFLLGGLVFAANALQDRINGGYSQFNAERAALGELGFLRQLTLAGTSAVQAETGWSANDIEALQAWFFFDSAIFNSARFNGAMQQSGHRSLTAGWRGVLHTHLIFLSEHVVQLAPILIFIFLIFIFNQFAYRRAFLFAVTFVWVNLILLAIAFALKYPPFRVQYPLWTIAGLLLLVLLQPVSSFRVHPWLIVAAIFLFAFSGVNIYRAVGNSQESRRRESEMFVFLRSLPNAPIVVDWAGGLPTGAISPFAKPGVWNGEKVFTLGVFQRAPQDQAFLKRSIGERSLLDALVEQHHPLVIADVNKAKLGEILKQYYAEHRNTEVHLKPILRASDYAAYIVLTNKN